MPKLILLRHGQSLWNKNNRFTGWVDVPLSEKGIEEAKKAGEKIRDINIDTIFTSLLIRAQMTTMLAMQMHPSEKTPILIHEENSRLHDRSGIFDDSARENSIPVYIDWRLNERHYGKLQGLDKQTTRDQFGEDQVKIWRRSYDVPPPEGESLKMTAERTLPCLHARIIPELDKDHNILISAHGNSLRSIVMSIEKLSTEEVLHLEIATGQPFVYEYANGNFERIS